jgi:hypothetical protein
MHGFTDEYSSNIRASVRNVGYIAATIENEALSVEVRLRACSAMAQCGGVYRALLESSDYAERLDAIESRIVTVESHLVESPNGIPR